MFSYKKEDQDKLRASCKKVVDSCNKLEVLMKAEKKPCPVEEVIKPLEISANPKKKEEAESGVAFEQRLPINWGAINVVQN